MQAKLLSPDGFVAAMRDIGRLVIEADAEPHKLASLQHSGVPLLIAD